MTFWVVTVLDILWLELSWKIWDFFEERGFFRGLEVLFEGRGYECLI